MQYDLELWQFIEKNLKTKQNVMLLFVVESSGSSPGRQGFKMAITTEGVLFGSIGGGIMEEKLVELAKDKVKNNDFTPFLKKQIHRKDTPQYQSGMICSGEQTILFYLLKNSNLDIVRKIIRCLKKSTPSVLSLSPTLFSFKKHQNNTSYIFENKPNTWRFEENLGFKKQLFIIGGGHCSLALSELMAKMDFYIRLFDDRENLNTFENNPFVHEKHIIDYAKIADFIPEGDPIYVVIMTVGYRSDEKIIRQLLGKKFKYIGVLGSQAKADKLKQNLLAENFTPEQVAKLNMPIGLKINSQTPLEIAISIAAQLISLKP